MQALDIARRIGVMGDTHGETVFVTEALAKFHSRGIKTIVQLGDFGFPWPGADWEPEIDRISEHLAERQQVLYFVDGNHDWHPVLKDFPLGSGGEHWLASNIAYLPRGHRIQHGQGKVFGSLGGANSADRDSRIEGINWWAEEEISDADVAALGTNHVDVLFGHEAPIGSPELDEVLLASRKPSGGIRGATSPMMRAYSKLGREAYMRGFTAVTPDLVFAGHWHCFADVTGSFPDSSGGVFESRVVVLDECTLAWGPSMAILNPQTLEVEAFK